MNIWFVIWVFIATFILATTVWSYSILLRQRRAWEAVAKKVNLSYSSDAILKSPLIHGFIDNNEVEVFSEKPISGKSRDGVIRTIFQVTIKKSLPTEGAIASMAFKNFIDGMPLDQKIPNDDASGLHKDIYNRVRGADLLLPYLTKERINAINAVLTIKNMPALLIFSQGQTLLRVESQDPFDNQDKLEKFLTKLTDAAKIISP